MRRQRLRVELRLDGELKARYQGGYVEISECGVRAIAVAPKTSKPVRKDHNAGGRSNWMQGFFDRPSPPLWKLIGDRREYPIWKARFFKAQSLSSESFTKAMDPGSVKLLLVLRKHSRVLRH